MNKTKKLYIIGRREQVNFPELNIFNIIAKIDTGAYTTALHCHDIQIKKINNESILCFKLLDPSHPEYHEHEHRFKSYSKKKIKSSSGEAEERFVIRTIVEIAKKKIICSLSLTDRGNMKYPVLIGRKMLKNKFIVDVNKIHTGGILVSNNI